MLLRTPIKILLAGTLLAASAAAQARPARVDPRHLLLDDARGQAGVNYDSLLNRALAADSSALRRLFELADLDGMGAEEHSQVLWALAGIWDDARFAAILRAEPDSVRARVICSIDLAADTSYAGTLPLTFGVAPHDPKCRDW